MDVVTSEQRIDVRDVLSAIKKTAIPVVVEEWSNVYQKWGEDEPACHGLCAVSEIMVAQGHWDPLEIHKQMLSYGDRGFVPDAADKLNLPPAYVQGLVEGFDNVHVDKYSFRDDTKMWGSVITYGEIKHTPNYLLGVHDGQRIWRGLVYEGYITIDTYV